MHSARHTGQNGFTLVELLVVCVLIALMLSVAVPNVRSLYYTDPLTQSARLIERTIERAQSTALEKDSGVLLLIDDRENSLSVYPAETTDENYIQSDPDFTAALPSGVVLSSVFTGSAGAANERDSGASILVWINRRGMIEPLVINIKSEGGTLGLTFSPFLPVEMRDRETAPDAPRFAQVN